MENKDIAYELDIHNSDELVLYVFRTGLVSFDVNK